MWETDVDLALMTHHTVQVDKNDYIELLFSGTAFVGLNRPSVTQ